MNIGNCGRKIPVPEPAVLRPHHVHEREAPGQHHDPEEAQDQGHLVEIICAAPRMAPSSENVERLP
jgi:hypothetical protein